MTGRATTREFQDLLRLDSTLQLSQEQIRQISLLLSLAGATPPPQYVHTLQELESLPLGTLVRDSDGDLMFKASEDNWILIGTYLAGNLAGIFDEDLQLPAVQISTKGTQ